jgi:3',5'-cyclic-nucleotide phosphodiesterase
MELRVLGCHGGETPKHRTSSFLLDAKVAIDAGAVTSMLTLEEQQRIETVLVSHAHLDHVRDLATLADNRCQQGGPTLVVAGIRETIEALRRHFFNDLIWPDFAKIPAGRGMTLEFRELVPEEPALLSGMRVTPVMVHHTIDAAGFLIETSTGAIAYSGDTGPTTRFWEHLNAQPDLRALLMEVSFPDEHHRLARLSGHHTPQTLEAELRKLRDHRSLPILLYHIKPVFEARVEKELTQIRDRNLDICRLGDHFVL